MQQNKCYNFTCDEQNFFVVKGRGTIFMVNETLPEDLWNPSQLVNETVTINGKPILVTGVDKFAINVSPDYPYRFKFGIMGNWLTLSE